MLNCFPIWQVSNILDLQDVHIFIFNPMIPVANTKLGIEFKHVEDPKCLKLVIYFYFYSVSTKTNFGFCSCSELVQGNAICSACKTVTGLTKVVERLQCAFSCIVGVKVAQRYGKIMKIEAYLRTQTNNFYKIFCMNW